MNPMLLITAKLPDAWDELEDLVAAILTECGMKAQRQVSLQLPRGSVDVDVLAEESVDGITHRIICECKNWRVNIPKEVVHAFRTVMQETGANRGYIVSRVGFQSGAIEAAKATNIELATFEEFQNIYFDKWISKRIWAIEHAIENFNTYYEPLGKPGYSMLQDDDDRAAYDAVWYKYLFAGLMLMPFSPYMRLVKPHPFPELPFDVSGLDEVGVQVPPNIRAATAYREFFQLLEGYARTGLPELRAVNPVTRGRPPASIERDD
jgi:Restriction endonuclease